MDTRLPQGFQMPKFDHLKAKDPGAFNRGYDQGRSAGYKSARMDGIMALLAGVFMGAFGMACIWLVVGLLR